MPRQPEIGNVQLYPNRPLRRSDKNGFVLKFYCPIRGVRIRKNCGTRDRREARRIQRECQERLISGEYLDSDGAITAAQAAAVSVGPVSPALAAPDRGRTWDECCERYRQQRASRIRSRSLVDIVSRLEIAERILRDYFRDKTRDDELWIRECCTLDVLEYLQERLLAGDECRYDRRSAHTVNSMLAAVMAFVRYCHAHDWIEKVPRLPKLDTDDKMKGRPITADEFQRLLDATPRVVGPGVADSWTFTLHILWESGFRIADVMDFSWDDDRHIHPVWPTRAGEHPTLVIPSTQKNGEHQVIPMLPGLRALLLSVPEADRTGWVVNPRPVEYQLQVSDERTSLRKATRDIERLTTERVSRLIARIGRQAEVIVRQADARKGTRVKYASAHDLRRGCALRLINAGVSAETLMVVMRHADFATTQKFYGAMRSAQSAAAEVLEKLSTEAKPMFLGGKVGGQESDVPLSADQLAKLKALLASL